MTAPIVRDIQLYEFALGVKVWRYTTNAENVSDPSGNVWEAVTISDDGVKQSGESTSDALSLTVSSDIIPARLFMFSPPSRPIEIAIYRASFAEKTATSWLEGSDSTVDSRVLPVTALRAIYMGEISQCSFPTPGEAVFTCETISASMRREGLRLGWQKGCPYLVYDEATCKLSKAAFAAVFTVQSISGNTINVTSTVTDPAEFSGGFIEYEHPIKGSDVMPIEYATSGAFVTFGFSADFYVGMTITAYPGCSGTPDACKARGNYLQYGGFENLPGKSPFDGDPVF